MLSQGTPKLRKGLLTALSGAYALGMLCWNVKPPDSAHVELDSAVQQLGLDDLRVGGRPGPRLARRRGGAQLRAGQGGVQVDPGAGTGDYKCKRRCKYMLW